VGMLLGFIRGAIMGAAGERVVARLRNRLYQHILGQEMGFFDARKTGELVSRLGSDTLLVQQATTSSIAEATVGVLKVLGSIMLMLTISWKLTTIVFGVALLLLALAVPFGQWIGHISKLYQDALGKAANASTEAMGAMRTVRAFSGEEVERPRYASFIGDPSQGCCWGVPVAHNTLYHGVKKAVVASGSYTSGFFVFFGAMYCCLWYGFILVVEGELSFGDMTAFQSYIFQVAFGTGQLGVHITALFTAQGGATRIFELLERDPHEPEGSLGGLAPTTLHGEVHFDAVDFAYPSRPDVLVLKNFTLSVPAESTAAIVGSSGSGKSTLLALLARFYTPSAGRILVDGLDVTSLDIVWLRHQMALVQQEPVLFGMSVRDNVCYGRSDTVPPEEVQAACHEANAHLFISQFPEGYDTLVGERGVRLSGGQKQRIAIARALLMAPRILLLDEATSALDAEAEHLVQEAIDRIMVGRTVLVVAHRLSTVRDADQIAVTSAGGIVDVGKHDELLGRCDTYQNLVRRQMAGRNNDWSAELDKIGNSGRFC